MIGTYSCYISGCISVGSRERMYLLWYHLFVFLSNFMCCNHDLLERMLLDTNMLGILVQYSCARALGLKRNVPHLNEIMLSFECRMFRSV